MIITHRETQTHTIIVLCLEKKLYNLALMTLFDIHTGLCSSFGFILNSISYAKWKSRHYTAKYLIPAGAQYFSSTAEQKIIYMHLIFCVCVNFLNFLSPLLLFSLFSFSLTSSSQVSIHHHAGGHLSSDSFVNVNYCSLSGVVSAHGEQYLQGCPSPTRMCKNPEQPAYRFTFFWTCPSSLASLYSWILWILLCTLLFYWS